MAAPSAGAILADLGADVIKVEPLTGDPMRSLSRPIKNDDVSDELKGYDFQFDVDNRGKESIAVAYVRAQDLDDTPDGAQVVCIAEHDAVLDSHVIRGRYAHAEMIGNGAARHADRPSHEAAEIDAFPVPRDKRILERQASDAVRIRSVVAESEGGVVDDLTTLDGPIKPAAVVAEHLDPLPAGFDHGIAKSQ